MTGQADNPENRMTWSRNARDWALIRSPLRPCAEDLAILRELSAPAWDKSGERCVGLILGVTPEFAALPWPPSTTLLAVDRSRQMIDAVWPGNDRILAAVAQGLWQHLPVASGSVDLAVGDGCLTALASAREYRRFFEQLALALAPQGRIVMRSFVRLEPQESMADVFEAVERGAIGNMSTLKWRLAMAAQTSVDDGASLRQVHRAFCERWPDRDALASRVGWARAAIDTIDAYENTPGTYAFPTLQEIERSARGLFSIDAVRHGSYELAERCPTLLLRPVS
ncbi:MAG: hypothetical protein JSW68_01190 [Burkholderiales bacterium]|nr:MAG: hypothetical protein JSW68_01190 [Burkholderiales bacterium]